MEVSRQLLHIGVGAFALLLRDLTWPQAVALASIAIVFNAFVLPSLAPGVFRDTDRGRRWTSGIVLYPIGVLALLLLFPARLDLVATTWALLAAGDGMATLVGAHVRTSALPWNREKSVGGLVAFLLFGGTAAAGMTWWSASTPPDAWLFVAPIAAAVLAGFAETAPITLDDNITVPAMAAAVRWCMSDMTPEVLRGHLAAQGPATMALVALNAAVAAAGWAARMVTGAGAVTGACIGGVMIVGSGVAGWTMLMATFLAASLATRVGHSRKARAGIAEDRGGRRGPGNAIANTGVAAWAALIAAGSANPTIAHLALVAALATAGSDTVASEVGKAWGRTTWLLTSLKRVAPGTTGAISLEGTAAGILSSALLAGIGAWVGLISAGAVPLVIVAANAASLMEGVIGATMEARGMLTNDVVNFVNSAMGAGVAMLAWSLF